MGLSKRSVYAAHSKRVTKSRRWKALRIEVLRRDEWKCQRCGDMRRLEVDHILPVKTHPELSFAMENLQVLCCRCHAAKTRIEVGHKPLSLERQQWRDFMKTSSKRGTPNA